jgi:hypothetical protein
MFNSSSASASEGELGDDDLDGDDFDGDEFIGLEWEVDDRELFQWLGCFFTYFLT